MLRRVKGKRHCNRRLYIQPLTRPARFLCCSYQCQVDQFWTALLDQFQTGFVSYVVFFVMRLKTRTVEVAGITSEPMCRPALFICGPQGIDLCRAARFRRSFAER